MTEAFGLLIRYGHGLHDLTCRYTMDQVDLFYENALERRNSETLSMALAMRAAFHANKRQWSKYVGDLSPSKVKVKKLEKSRYDELRRISRRLSRG